MLAAYYDRSLMQSERDRLEGHLADCARCQMQLAAIARADEPAAEARPAFGIAWLRRWQVAISALGAAAAVVLIIVVMHPGNDVSRREQVLAMAKREVPASSAAAPSSPPVAQLESAPMPA